MGTEWKYVTDNTVTANPSKPPSIHSGQVFDNTVTVSTVHPLRVSDNTVTANPLRPRPSTLGFIKSFVNSRALLGCAGLLSERERESARERERDGGGGAEGLVGQRTPSVPLMVLSWFGSKRLHLC